MIITTSTSGYISEMTMASLLPPSYGGSVDVFLVGGGLLGWRRVPLSLGGEYGISWLYFLSRCVPLVMVVWVLRVWWVILGGSVYYLNFLLELSLGCLLHLGGAFLVSFLSCCLCLFIRGFTSLSFPGSRASVRGTRDMGGGV